MPNRIIKESIKTSKTVNAMTDFQFRVWMYLITYVDDYGRGSADPELLKGFVFPRRKRVSESDIAKTLAELAGMGCIVLYEVDGESYFYFPKWGDHQRIQTKRSKFPEPLNGSEICSSVGHGESPPESESELELESESKTEYESQPHGVLDFSDYSFSPQMKSAITDWFKYKKEKRQEYKPTGAKSLLSQIQNKLKNFTEQQLILAISESMASNYQGIVWDKAKTKDVQQSNQQQGLTGIEKLRQRMEDEKNQKESDIIDAQRNA